MRKTFYVICVFLSMMGNMMCLASCGDDDTSTVETVITNSVVLSESELLFSKSEGSATFVITGAISPQLSSDADWCSVSVGAVDADTKSTCTVTVSANTTYDERVARITVRQGNVTRQVVVTQSQDDGLTVGQTSYFVSASGGQVSVTVKANVDFTETISEPTWVSATSTRGLKAYTRTYSVAANEGEARTATVIYRFGELADTVTITQAAYDPGNITATAADIAKLMYPGWNLGNTLEACGGEAENFTNKGGVARETYWQKTKTTQQVIDAVRDAGFHSVRIPVSWVCGHISGGTESEPVIDEKWMARVKEVVDYCVSDGLYVVLNDHWDGGWLEVLGFSGSSSSYKSLSGVDVNKKIMTLKYLWTQIANEFKDYDEHVLFAGLNEPFQEYSLFNSRHSTLTSTLVKYNKAFVEAVRVTGGNNNTRTLVVQGPGANVSSACTYMGTDKLPEEAGHLMVEVHYYDPGQFCGTYDSNVYFWGTDNHSTLSASNNATWGEESYMVEQFDKLKQTYTSKGYPVILGEYGAVWRTISTDKDKHNASIRLFYKLVNQYGVERGIIPFTWDTNGFPSNPVDGTMTIINRADCTIYNSYALEGVKEGVSAAQWPY